jgi:hypothetical protein
MPAKSSTRGAASAWRPCYHIPHFPGDLGQRLCVPPFSDGLPFSSQSKLCVSYCHRAMLLLPRSVTLVIRAFQSNYYATQRS